MSTEHPKSKEPKMLRNMMLKNQVKVGVAVVVALGVLWGCGSGGGGDTSSPAASVPTGGGGGTVGGGTGTFTVASATPASGASNVGVAAPMSVTFARAVDCTTVTASSLSVAGVTGTVSCSGATAVLSHTAPLAYATSYTVQLGAGVKDTTGTALSGTRSWSFTTASAPTAGNSFTFLAYGDSRAGNLCDSNAVHIGLVDRMKDEPASMVFHLGDMIAGLYNTTNWVDRGDCPDDASQGSFKNIIAPLQSKRPAAGLPMFFFPVVGNHDDSWEASAATAWYPDNFGRGICDVFDMRALVKNHTQSHDYFLDWGGSGHNPDIKHYSDAEFSDLMCSTDRTKSDVYPTYMYYSFDFKNSHFVVLRVNMDDYDLMVKNHSGLSDETNYDNFYQKHQLDWLRYDLAQAAAKAGTDNIFVFLHAPLVTSNDEHSANVSANVLLKEFSKYSDKVKLVVSGHAHVYERTYPVFATEANPGGVRDDAKGTVYTVTGGGGSPLHGFHSPLSSPHTRIANSTYHYLRIDVSGNTVNVKAIKQDGSTIDSYSR
jgi:hypothetical protein